MAANSMAAQNPGARTRHAPSTTAASAADSQAVCHFLDKVAAEIRVMIYEHVFGASEYARLSSTPTDQPVSATNADSTAEAAPAMINTSILATSKQTREEALDAFYNTKIVRFDFIQLRDLLNSRASGQSDQLDMVQNIEIVDCNQVEPSDSIHSTLKEALTLPRIKSLSILSDCLTGPDRRHVTAREEAHRLGLGSVTCCNVGRYRIGELPENVQFINSKLVRMWPSAASMPDDYEALDVANLTWSGKGISGEYSQNLLAWASHTSFRLWVGLHEIATTPLTIEDPGSNDWRDPAVNEYNRKTMDRSGFIRCIVSDPPRVCHVSNSPDQDVPLHKLGPQHDPLRLEQATEILAMNIGRYKWLTHDEDDWPTDEEIKPSWVELGDSNVLEIQSERHRKFRALLEENNTINWPTDPTRACRLSEVREELLGCHIFPRAFGQETILNADKRELRQLWYLRLAIYALVEESPDDDASNDQHADNDGDSRDQEDDSRKDVGPENGVGQDATTEKPEVTDEAADGIVEDDQAAMHEWSTELMRKYLSRVEGVDEAQLSEASEKKMRRALIMAMGFASGLIKARPIEESDPEGTDPGSPPSSTEQPENEAVQPMRGERSGDGAEGDWASGEASNIDEDLYQPFLDSHTVMVADVFKAIMAGVFDNLDWGGA